MAFRSTTQNRTTARLSDLPYRGAVHFGGIPADRKSLRCAQSASASVQRRAAPAIQLQEAAPIALDNPWAGEHIDSGGTVALRFPLFPQAGQSRAFAHFLPLVF
jgi:hypothetical protein